MKLSSNQVLQLLGTGGKHKRKTVYYGIDKAVGGHRRAIVGVVYILR
jgi:hypothetical protein